MLSPRFGEYGFYAERQFVKIFGAGAIWNQVGGLGGSIVYAKAEDADIVQKGEKIVQVILHFALRSATDKNLSQLDKDNNDVTLWHPGTK